jgi:glycosyltransferase involved in cell wall biosynthesis
MQAFQQTLRANSAALTLAAYTHFGAAGLKGIETYHMAREAWKRGYLQKIFAVSKKRCKYDFDLSLVETLPGESRIINGLGKIKGRVWEGFPSRLIGEMIIDYYASSKLSGPGGVLITTPGMLRTSRKAKALGYTPALYGAVPDPRSLLEHIKAEKNAFGLKQIGNNRERSWIMSRFTGQLKSTDYIIAISEFVKESYIEYGFPAKNIFVAHMGVELDKFTATIPPADGRITYLFVGHVNETIGPVKGLQYLLQAWSELDLKNARLVACGKMGEEAQELIRRYSDKMRNVEFVGDVRNPAEYFQKASVLVFPPVTEGFGKVVLEAMACGRAVIATPIPRPVIREGIDGFYVPSRDVEGLKQRMLYFHQHPDQVAKMGANAGEQARKFTWERFSQQIADIVEEISKRQQSVR